MPAEYPTSIRMSPDLKKILRKMAKVQGCTIAFKIKEILLAHVASIQGAPLREESDD